MSRGQYRAGSLSDAQGGGRGEVVGVLVGGGVRWTCPSTSSELSFSRELRSVQRVDCSVSESSPFMIPLLYWAQLFHLHRHSGGAGLDDRDDHAAPTVAGAGLSKPDVLIPAQPPVLQPTRVDEQAVYVASAGVVWNADQRPSWLRNPRRRRLGVSWRGPRRRESPRLSRRRWRLWIRDAAMIGIVTRDTTADASEEEVMECERKRPERHRRRR